MGSTPNLAQIFLMRFRPRILTFYVDPKSKMASLASDWPTHFQLFLKNSSRDLIQTLHRCYLILKGPDQVLLLFMWNRNPRWPPLII